jgi:hypothetical protein
MHRVNITNNNAVRGGGLYSEERTNSTMENSVIDKNVAVLGGGIYAACSMSHWYNISVVANNASNGGGVTIEPCLYNIQTVGGWLFYNFSFVANEADQGGAMFILTQQSPSAPSMFYQFPEEKFKKNVPHNKQRAMIAEFV